MSKVSTRRTTRRKGAPAPDAPGAGAQEVERGGRAQQKLDTRRRIRDAAWALFTELGYEETTTKAVAERAEVAAGTVFVHARDKADLLMLVMHDRLGAAVDAAFETLPRREPLLGQLMHVFQALFAMYGEHPRVAQAFVRAYPGAAGPNGERMSALTFAFLHRIAGLVRDAQARGEVAADIDPLAAAHNVFALYFAALLSWLSGFVTLGAALDPVLKNALALQHRGLRA
ncbi:TetR family transcriptional regulator [Sorangium cellulosum]|uniref:TetR family transcriptional regulator n=1 Tax=Sorangium cellulosum TaxID=56 RepID=A0A4P2QDK3_SORCE|nr:TetR/AcrR family transcriptional regulator [Sorangium cellulosum]AUX27769.1 TetR family transcriptional regulator [Sorangium cellulosum]